MTTRRNTTRREWLTYATAWGLMYAAPLVSLYVHASLDEHFQFRWIDVLHIWSALTVMLVIFLVHNQWLAPMLIHRRNTRTYILCTVALVALFGLYECLHQPSHRGPRPPELELAGTPAGTRRQPGPPHREPIPPLGLNGMMSLSMLVMIFGANLGVKYMFKGIDDEKLRQRRQQEGLKQELTYLKHQMNPHFFMNTLNNIHALVDIDPEKAKACIVKLGHMMRYMLYECNKDTVALSRSIAMMEHHIELMRIRYDEKVDIQLKRPDQIPSIDIPPLIIIPFVENAFKHGVSYSEHSFIHITVDFTDTHFVFTCTNSKHAEAGSEHGGVGLRNVVKRLRLIYGNHYTLDIDNADDHYKVTLQLPIALPQAKRRTEENGE